jgi:hypothetical protein
MLDIEMLRIEKLIVEREAYENAFFSMEPNDIEFELTIPQFDDCQEFIVEPFNYEDELIEPFEDYLEKLREEKLISERIAYEMEYSKKLNYKIIEGNSESLTEPYSKPDYHLLPYYDMYPDDFFDHCPVEEPTFRKPSCNWGDMDYMPNDDSYEDCYYYPDGDLLGIYPL